MTRDPRVDLVFSHNLPRYVAIGVDWNDAQRLIARIERWEDWCRLWSEEATRHEALAQEAREKGRAVTAAEAYVRAAIYYHCGKHLFSLHATEWPRKSPPPLQQEVFRAGAHARTAQEAQLVADKLTLVGAADRITCPLLVVVGGADKLVPPSEGERSAKTAAGPTELVVYPEGDHVCFNISYKYRPLTADWMAERLASGQA